MKPLNLVTLTRSLPAAERAAGAVRLANTRLHFHPQPQPTPPPPIRQPLWLPGWRASAPPALQ